MTGPTGQTPSESRSFDLIIIGGGVAGLSVLLTLPAHLRVALLTKAALGESNTRYAQGGLAAPVGLDDDPELQLRDTLTAGAGLVDETAARAMLSEARESVAWLVAQGTQFDEREGADALPSDASAQSGDPLHELATRYDLTLEAAHSRRRVLHAHGDATGAEIERALVASARRRPNTEVIEHALALELVVEAGACVGVDALIAGQTTRLLAARGVVLANGGAGRLWLRTSNPAGATADGVALAWRAGAALADLEFCQFHPTILAVDGPDGEPFLVSEAVRGEGAVLRNARGERFMPRYHKDAELAPRDVVARAILSEMLAEDAPAAYLDLRHLPAGETRERFPSITEACRVRGLDLATDLIPVAPAAHYYMGGVVTDTWGRTTLPGLYAVGEVSCTGVHGANRLASNSLLEGLVFGRRASRLIAEHSDGAARDWPATPALTGPWVDLSGVVAPHAEPSAPVSAETRTKIQRVMWQWVSLRRDADGLEQALRELRTLAAAGPYDPETANMLLVAQGITLAALNRTESRGGHYRTDFPERDQSRDGRHTMLWPAQAARAGREALHVISV
ncbi:MAG TPA: L-aspartate oxidase [Ktedonobacterales bacterium]